MWWATSSSSLLAWLLDLVVTTVAVVLVMDGAANILVGSSVASSSSSIGRGDHRRRCRSIRCSVQATLQQRLVYKMLVDWLFVFGVSMFFGGFGD